MQDCEVSLNQILEARERRAALQRSTLSTYGGPLLCFTMNLAGPVKRSPLSDFAFLAGERMIQSRGFHVRQHIRLRQPTGMEAIYALEADPYALKAVAMELEEALPVGRLFDMDVIGLDGMKLPRPQPRTCLVCGGPAAPCARSRAHGLEAVQAATASLLEAFAADALGEAARDALLEEAHLTPKPGLIDLANNGAHKDMDLESFRRSAQALTPYFKQAVQIGLSHPGSGPAMEALRPAGIAAEAAMLEATGGANTHKGLIYALGLLLCAMGQTLAGGGENYINHARQLANIGLPEALRRAKAAPCSHGERIYAHRGVLGARGEAAAGFPHAVQALEALRQYRSGATEHQARLLTLVTSMAQLTDTNLLHRGGEAGLHLVQREARRILDLPLNQLEDALQALDRLCIERNLSPGGSADMLALALFLDRVEGWFL